MKKIIDDRFSWKRVRELYTYCSPYINRQVKYYGIAILLLTIMSLLPLGNAGQFMIFTLVWSIIPYMGQFAPLIFAKGGDSRIIDRLVPALPMEKYIFYLSYILIVIPAICYILPTLASWLYTLIPAIQTSTVLPLIEMRLNLPTSVTIINVLTYVDTTLTCFTVVTYCRSNRVIKGIISVFAVQIVVGMVGAVYGFIYAMNEGYKDISGHKLADPNPEAIVNNIMTEMTWSSAYMIGSLAILLIYLALIIRISYRAVNYRNL